MIPPETELAYKLFGSMIYGSAEVRQRILLSVQESDFTDETVRKIYGTIAQSCRDFPQADDTVLLERLDSEALKTIVATWQAMPVREVTDAQLSDTLNAFRHIKNQNALKEAAAELAFGDEIHTADCQRLLQLSESLMPSKQQSAAEKYLADYGKEIRLIPTGFPELDKLLGGGLAVGTVAAIGARPSVGKTTFSLNIAAANPDKKVLFFSIEMTARMIYDRLIADKAEVLYTDAISHKVPLTTAKAVLDKYPSLLLVDDVSHVESIADRIYSEKPDVVIIDFVQIVTSERRFVDNRQRIDYISQRLKQAVKAVGCCLIILSQLTRAGKDKPTMSDLKESGGLEQDSDYVLLLHRPYVQDKTNSEHRPEDTTVICDKNKFGQTGELPFIFEGQYQRFLSSDGKGVARPKKAVLTGEGLPV
ncbi:MAG: DnaB-like helicase C-terminal domain-containing protein [Acidaminococcaceae bacterium]|nr:DnaB-like helicase C-terminal domain-containing protein [Acidaminococcaceae bacterium]